MLRQLVVPLAELYATLPGGPSSSGNAPPRLPRSRVRLARLLGALLHGGLFRRFGGPDRHGRLRSWGDFGRNTRAGQVADVLNTTGMYSIVRHPLYLGNFVIWLGVAMYCGVWWFVVIVVLLFWLYYERIMFAEEEFLRRKFGDTYVEWAAATPAFLPRLKGWRRAELPFSLRSVLRREYPGLFAIVAAFYVLKVYERVVIHRDPTVEPVWSGVFLAGLATFLTLRTLKRKTRLLAVEGR